MAWVCVTRVCVTGLRERGVWMPGRIHGRVIMMIHVRRKMSIRHRGRTNIAGLEMRQHCMWIHHHWMMTAANGREGI